LDAFLGHIRLLKLVKAVNVFAGHRENEYPGGWLGRNTGKLAGGVGGGATGQERARGWWVGGEAGGWLDGWRR
jgi:hypothetical protein